LDILCVDEIGHLELNGEGFVKSLTLIGAKKIKNSLLVIRKELLPAFLARLGPTKPSIIEANHDNRNELPQKICMLLGCNIPAYSSLNRVKGDDAI